MAHHRKSSQPRKYGIARRDFLSYLAAVSAIPTIALRAEGEVAQRPRFDGNPFTFGVASGDPEPNGIVLWTRLAPQPLQGGGMPNNAVPTRWEVADDEAFANVVQSGVAWAMPQLGHSVHVEVDGLEPHRWYFYRFHAGDETSPIGRTRTAPAYDAMPDRLKFAFTSCQHYESGYFNGYPHMQQEDLDLVVHLGDYIYEYAGIDKRPRKHIGGEVKSLDDYRIRYTQYRLDETLQETHRLFPWLVTWDDHEFDNNYANLVSEEDGISPEAFLARRMNAYQAYYEFMPLRRRSFPQGPHMKLYRGCQYGRLANFHVLDTRQYRSDQPNGDHQKPMIGKALDPQATMLGAKQEHWLMSSLLKSPSTWNVLAQQVMMAPLNRGEGEYRRYSMDQWPGYEISRRRLLRFFHERNIPNPVVLTGDIHLNWVNDLQLDFEDPKSPLVGTELVGTSMTSSGNGGNHIPEYERAAAQNDFVRWYNSNRGYVSCELTPKTWTSHFRVTPYVDKPGAPILTKGSFVIQQGQPGAKPA
ncbi:Alkaline phosphatase D precursor [Symmachiella macrocystis]|uniref:Alkaline phosphatase D n=1 Tax=Symmachiella macrocystis TaxID=2527985 RepID=A0A5C6B1D5_9PLAN|nr:alkaline phosphatase D family protein [Symmachiella macrocystis]TWU05222.1 Alkaline phosphatase D precursor [Symmachiella macrocystis]